MNHLAVNNKADQREQRGTPTDLNVSDPSLASSHVTSARLWGEPRFNADSSYESKLKNASLRNAWESRDKVSWLVARVIHQELNLTLPQFLKDTPFSRSQILTITNGASSTTVRSGSSDPLFSALLRHWESLLPKLSPAVASIVTEAQEKLVKYLVARESTPTLRLLRTWRLENSEAFDSAWGAEYKVFRKGHKHSALSLNVPEMISIAQKIGRVPANLNGAALWRHEVVRQIRDCYRHEVKSRGGSIGSGELIAALDFAGIHTSAEGMMKSSELRERGLSWNVARALYRFEPVPAAAIAPIINLLVERKIFSSATASTLLQRFAQDYHNATAEVTFATRVTTLLSDRGISYADIAAAMNLERKSRIEGAKSVLVRMTVENGTVLSACPAGVVALFAARSKEEFSELLALKRAEITRAYGIQRSSPIPHPLKVERSLWGVSEKHLPFSVELIQNTEWRKRVTHLSDQQVGTAISAVQAIGTRRAVVAVNRFLTTRQPSTIYVTIDRIADLCGVPFVRNSAGISTDRSERIFSRSEFPTRPHTERILAAVGVNASPTINRRWHFECAEFQVDTLRPLGRALTTQVLATASDTTNFVSQAGFSKSVGSIFRRTIAVGLATPETLSTLIEKMELKPNSFREKFLFALNARQDMVSAAISVLDGMRENQRNSMQRKILALDKLSSYDPDAAGASRGSRSLSFERIFEAMEAKPFSVDYSIPVNLRGREERIGKILPELAGMTRTELQQLARHIRGEDIMSELTSPADSRVFDQLEKRALSSRFLGEIISESLPVGQRKELRSAIEFALSERQITPATPFGLLAGFAARDLNDFNRLLAQKRTEIGERSPGLNALRIEESLWGFDFKMSRERFAEMVSLKEGAADAATVQKIGQLQERALEIVGDALTLYLTKPSPVLTTHIIQACLDRCGMNGQEFARHTKTKASRIVGYVRGVDLPDLPAYRKILDAAGITCTAAMEARWQLDFALLKSRSAEYSSNPLGVAIETLIARDGRYIQPILTARGIDISLMKVIARLKTDNARAGDLEQFCCAWKVSSQSPTYQFLNLLQDSRSTEEAVQGVCTMIAQNPYATRERDALIELRSLLESDIELSRVPKTEKADIEAQMKKVGLRTEALGGDDTFNAKNLREAVAYFPGAGRPVVRRALSSNTELTHADPNTRAALVEEWRRQAHNNAVVVNSDVPRLLQELPISVLKQVLHGAGAFAGTTEKIDIIDYRGQLSLPFWHPADSAVVMPDTSSQRDLASFLEVMSGQQAELEGFDESSDLDDDE